MSERPRDPQFSIGDMVGLRVDRSRQGLVAAILPPVGGRSRYRVFHSVNDQREYYEAQLIVVANQPERSSSIADALAGVTSERLDAATFRARLTAARLNNPQIDHIYALHAARIRFVPFQMKPLLRFLHADQPRLLIADEVGVGKTIEAGLILRELQARQQVGNVLIVCPKALVTKWRAEMLRFDEQFEPLDGPTLRYCLREAHLDGAWPQRFSRAIVHLELLRSENHLVGAAGSNERPGLLELDPPPSFSLTIVDEAHHLRNPDTRSHELARFLCDASEAVLFLSATPVHLGSQNLFTLLNLLRPDLFIDQTVFASMVEPNQYINAAMRCIRNPERSSASNGNWSEDAAIALESASATSWGAQTLVGDPRLTHWLDRLRSGDDLTDIERVRCLRDLEDVHTLSHVMNRTRRRDIGRFTIREPHTISVEFTPEQEAFYRALIDMRREMLLLEHDPFVVRLIIDTLERQASSCLPALVPMLGRFLRSGRFSAAEVTDDDESQGDTSAMLPTLLSQRAQQLQNLADALPADDPKLNRLLEIAASTRADTGPGKLLLFSYFLHTLGYLNEHLSAAGYRTAIISGNVPDEDRESLRNRFRLPRSEHASIDILLSSEVGCEGLDYEFCDRLVNYDIPWNPMRIEQRIGRIDRFGQRSDKVMIYNFITPGTVEERIFFRCFERIGIFHDTVGDLEEILSDTVQDLTRAALDPRLSPEQLDRLAQQKTHNVILLAEEQHRLEDQGSALLGVESAFVDEVDNLIADGRFVGPSELSQMIDHYLGQPDLSGRLTLDSQDDRLYRMRLNKSARMLILDGLRAENVESRDRASLGFQRWLDGDEPLLPLTFDQSLALEQRELTFITPVHPLARIAADYWGNQHQPLLARLTAKSDAIPPGNYVFACDLWETLAVNPEVQIVTHAWDIDRWAPDVAVAAHLISLLSKTGVGSDVPRIASETIAAALAEMDEQAHLRFSKSLDDLRDRNGHIVTRRLASLNSYYTNRLQRVERDIASTSDGRIQRMRHAERERIHREHAARQKELDDRRDADIVSQRVATGLLTIRSLSVGDHNAVEL